MLKAPFGSTRKAGLGAERSIAVSVRIPEDLADGPFDAAVLTHGVGCRQATGREEGGNDNVTRVSSVCRPDTHVPESPRFRPARSWFARRRSPRGVASVDTLSRGHPRGQCANLLAADMGTYELNGRRRTLICGALHELAGTRRWAPQKLDGYTRPAAESVEKTTRARCPLAT